MIFHIIVLEINVTISVPEEQQVGQSLTLECKIVSTSEVDSSFDIIWTREGMEVRSVRNISGSLLSNYSDLYTIPVLRRSDRLAPYQCDLIINLNQPVNRSTSILLENVTGTQVQ